MMNDIPRQRNRNGKPFCTLYGRDVSIIKREANVRGRYRANGSSPFMSAKYTCNPALTARRNHHRIRMDLSHECG